MNEKEQKDVFPLITKHNTFHFKQLIKAVTHFPNFRCNPTIKQADKHK